MVTIQKSRWNSPLEASFTIEVGLYWKDIQRDLCYWAGIDRPKAWDCLVRERIGALADGKDLWWDVPQDADVASIGRKVVSKLRSTGLPWLVAGHDVAVSFRYVSEHHGPAHSDAFKAVLEGRPIKPLEPPLRKGFLIVDNKEYDVRTKEGRLLYKKASKEYEREMRKRPRFVRFQGDDTEYDLNTKEGKQALKAFLVTPSGAQ